MKKLKYSLAALALVALAACNKAEMPGYLSDPDAVRIEAAVGVLTKSNPLGTVEEQRKFNDGDRISVTNAGETVVYKLNGGTWAPENSGEYLKWDKSDLTFTAKYPADYSEIPDDQDTKDKLAAADYMEGTPNLTSIPSDHILSIGLERKNVLVKIKILKYNDEYNEGTDEIRAFKIGGKKNTSGLFDFMVGAPLLQDRDGNVVTTGIGKVGYTYSAIVSPNAKGENSDGRFVNLDVYRDGQTLTGGAGIWVNGIPELVAGKSYTFELIVGKTTVKVGSVTVNDWTTGDKIDIGETEGHPNLWDGSVAAAFAGGTGTPDDPHLIATPAQLAYLADKVKGGTTYEGKYFRQTEDFDLGGNKWAPIGSYNHPFKGHFDGDNHEIFRLNADIKQAMHGGLFGYISSGSVKNIKVRSGLVKSSNACVGGIVGELNGSQMENCTASVNVSGRESVGGLVGRLSSGSNVSDCHFLSGEITGAVNNIGGIVGKVTCGNNASARSTVDRCSVNASVKGQSDVGGLCGWSVDGDHMFLGCTMKGSVTVTWENGGGLAGHIGSKGEFAGCRFEGSINGVGGALYTRYIGIAIGYDECSENASKGVTFQSCECIIDAQTNTSLNGEKVGYIVNKSAGNEKVRADGCDYSKIKVTVKGDDTQN